MVQSADFAEDLAALLTKDDPEPYNLSANALGEARALLEAKKDEPEFEETMRDVFRFAHFLATKLNSPEAGRALLAVGLDFKKVDDVFAPRAGARVDDDTWRKVLGGGAQDRRPVGSDKSAGGKKPWEILGS